MRKVEESVEVDTITAERKRLERNDALTLHICTDVLFHLLPLLI